MKILNKTAALSVLCLAAILTLSACSDKRQKGNERLAKEMAQVTEQNKKQEPEKRHQAMLEELNVIHYHNFDGYNHSIYTFEIDGVKCIVTDMKGTGISCDYNDEHIAKNLADKEKRLAAKVAQSNKQLEQIEETRLELQRQQGAGR